MWNLWTVAMYGFYSSDSIHGCEMSLWTLWITRSHSHGLNCFDRYRIQAHHKRYQLHLFVSTLLNKLLIFIGSTNYSIEAQNKNDYFPISTIRRKTVLPYILVHNWIGMELGKNGGIGSTADTKFYVDWMSSPDYTHASQFKIDSIPSETNHIYWIKQNNYNNTNWNNAIGIANCWIVVFKLIFKWIINRYSK